MAFNNKNENETFCNGAQQSFENGQNCAKSDFSETEKCGYDYTPGKMDPYLIVILSQL